jgi:hypothetical protein
MRTATVAALLMGSICLAGSAQGDVIFSDVSITGSLSTGASYSTGAYDIDFVFVDATVGDPTDPRRDGDLVISYEAENATAIGLDTMSLQVLGALQGSGTITFEETIEDLINPGTIASYSVVLDDNSELPHVAVIPFDRPSTRIRVEKTLTLEAFDTDAFDMANVSLIEQRLYEVPEPAAVVALVLGTLPLLRRR